LISFLLHFQYDFSLEEKVIEWSDAYKLSKQALNRVNAEQVGADIEQFTQLATDSATEVETDGAESEPDEAACDVNDCDTKTQCDLHLVGPGEEPPSSAPLQVIPNTNPLETGLGTGILIPTQLPTPKPRDISANSDKDGSFNPADFEREKEQDPFDNAELRVMNDLEELNKVLQNVQIVESVARSQASGMPTPIPAPRNRAVPVITGNSGQEVVMTHTVTQSVCQTQTHPPTGTTYPPIPPRSNYPKSVKDIDYPQLDSVENKYPVAPAETNSNNVYASSQKLISCNGLNYALPNSHRDQVNVSSSYAAAMGGNNPFPSSQRSAVCYNKAQDSVSGAMFPVKPIVPQSTQASLVNGQINYPYSILSHGAGYPTRDSVMKSSDNSTLNRLRSVRSTPDISKLSDDTPVYLPKSHTPPPDQQTQLAHWEAQKVICPLESLLQYSRTNCMENNLSVFLLLNLVISNFYIILTAITQIFQSIKTE
jgi:hypothetical protein